MTQHELNQINFIKTPKAGDIKKMHIFGKIQTVTILAVHAFGTLDIETASGNCYRVSGFSFI
jgi:hypothetical protein